MFQLPLVAYSNLQLSSEHEGDKRPYLLFLNISLYWKFGDYLYFLVSKAGNIENHLVILSFNQKLCWYNITYTWSNYMCKFVNILLFGQYEMIFCMQQFQFFVIRTQK